MIKVRIQLLLRLVYKVVRRQQHVLALKAQARAHRWYTRRRVIELVGGSDLCVGVHILLWCLDFASISGLVDKNRIVGVVTVLVWIARVVALLCAYFEGEDRALGDKTLLASFVRSTSCSCRPGDVPLEDVLPGAVGILGYDRYLFARCLLDCDLFNVREDAHTGLSCQVTVAT